LNIEGVVAKCEIEKGTIAVCAMVIIWAVEDAMGRMETFKCLNKCK